MKCNYNRRTNSNSALTSKEKQKMLSEIRKHVVQYDAEYRDNLDATVLYTLHQVFGFGKDRLRKFWRALESEHDKLVKYYELPEDGPWLCTELLKRIDVDVKSWNEEWEHQHRK